MQHMQGLALKYLSDLMRKTSSGLSFRSLQSADHLDLLVPTKTPLGQHRAFTIVDPPL